MTEIEGRSEAAIAAALAKRVDDMPLAAACRMMARVMALAVAESRHSPAVDKWVASALLVMLPEELRAVREPGRDGQSHLESPGDSSAAPVPVAGPRARGAGDATAPDGAWRPV
jgi:hypothetical protein